VCAAEHLADLLDNGTDRHVSSIESPNPWFGHKFFGAAIQLRLVRQTVNVVGGVRRLAGVLGEKSLHAGDLVSQR
jgi:hypothetical protein